jgi:hypothetical protein
MSDAIDHPDAHPLFIYDGDCAFCKYGVGYYQALTRNCVRFAPYQQVGRDYPEISAGEFHNSVQL